jgi:hypothetical protein
MPATATATGRGEADYSRQLCLPWGGRFEKEKVPHFYEREPGRLSPSDISLTHAGRLQLAQCLAKARIR